MCQTRNTSDFVVKKYKPIVNKEEESDLYLEFLERFKDEARILFRINHPNIVRVFNFYDYKEFGTAYILMEYVEGEDISDHISRRPDDAESVFEGVISAFQHLEARSILHRDIRPANILIDASGQPKVIDFGFGKEVLIEVDHNKSISLNWWCEPPPEFEDGVYDNQTEIYFVGKLFQEIILREKLSAFKYKGLVAQMCAPDRERRAATFSTIGTALTTRKFEELHFSDDEVSIYRSFISSLSYVVTSIDPSSKYRESLGEITSRLDALYRDSMLEEYLPAPNKIAQVFISGVFRYRKHAEFPVSVVKEFLDMLRGMSAEKSAIVLRNVIARLDGMERTAPVEPDLYDEIPF